MTPMTLTVHYLVRGNLETDQRTGHWFRWDPYDSGVHVFEYDEQWDTVWTKTYRGGTVTRTLPYKTRNRRIYAKLGVSSRAAAVSAGYRQGLLDTGRCNCRAEERA